MAAPKKPTLLKVPKKPAKKGRTIKSMQKWLDREKEVKAENARRTKKHNAAVKKYNELQKKIDKY